MPRMKNRSAKAKREAQEKEAQQAFLLQQEEERRQQEEAAAIAAAADARHANDPKVWEEREREEKKGLTLFVGG